MQRVDLLLDVGLIQEAYATVQRVLEVSDDDPGLKIMYADVVLADRGPAATRKFLAQLDLGDSVTATELLIATQLSLAVQDYPRAQALAARATASPDFSSVELAHRSLIRWGISYQLPLALLELHNGDRSSAIDRANALLRVLSELERSGYVNWGIHSVRADALGLLGDADGAMRALHRAVDSGWRSARLARRDPYLAQLVGRDDFMELMTRVDRLNASELSLYRAANDALIGD